MDARALRSPSVRAMPTGKRVTVLILTTLAALVLGAAGTGKLLGQEMQRQNFRDWDLPDSLRPVVGGVEVLLAILVVVPATRFWGGTAMLPWMLGAVATHLRVEQYSQAGFPVIIGALGIIAAILLIPPGLRRPNRA